MAELSNTSLAILVFSTLIVTVASTVYFLNEENEFVLTGRALSDTGNITLAIATSLNILVDPGNESIDFGTCTPRAATSYWCASNDALACDTIVGENCTADTTTPQFIRVENVGNINASVNVTSSCAAADLIGGTSPALNFVTTNCDGTGQATWTALSSTTELACDAIVPTTGAFQLYVNVTIPNDAVGGTGPCITDLATLTFSAT
jgi:hypothetical protein